MTADDIQIDGQPLREALDAITVPKGHTRAIVAGGAIEGKKGTAFVAFKGGEHWTIGTDVVLDREHHYALESAGFKVITTW